MSDLECCSNQQRILPRKTRDTFGEIQRIERENAMHTCTIVGDGKQETFKYIDETFQGQNIQPKGTKRAQYREYFQETSKETEIREYIEERLRRKESVYIKRLTRALHVGYCRAQRVIDEYINAGEIVKSAGFGYAIPNWKSTKGPPEADPLGVESNGNGDVTDMSESDGEHSHPTPDSPPLPKPKKYPLRSGAIKVEQLDDIPHSHNNHTTTTTSSHSSSPSTPSQLPIIQSINLASRKRKSPRVNHVESNNSDEASSSHSHASNNNNTTSSNQPKRYQLMARAIAMKCNISATPLPPPTPKITITTQHTTPHNTTLSNIVNNNNNAVNTPPKRGRPRIHFV